MIKYGLFYFLFCFLIQNISPSTDNEAQKLIKKIKDEQKLDDVGIFITKNGEFNTIRVCEGKGYHILICKIVIERIAKDFNAKEVKSFINRIKNAGKWKENIQYIKENGFNSAVDKYCKGFGSKTICKRAIYYMMKEGDNGEIPSLPIPGSIFIKYVQNNGDIHLIPKSGEYKYVYIFLHGLHDSPGRFVQKFGELRDPIFNSFKIIIPNAPKQRVNTYNGEIINSWFSIHRDKEDTSPFQEEEEVDFKELIKTSSKIKKIIFEEVYYKLHRDFSKIFIGGFSEGACLAYHIGLTLNHILGGIISFCGIPLKTTKKLPDNGMNLNILAILGGKDPIFPLNEAKHQIKSLIAGNNNLLIKEFPFSGHQVTDDEIREMKSFILNKIKE